MIGLHIEKLEEGDISLSKGTIRAIIKDRQSKNFSCGRILIRIAKEEQLQSIRVVESPVVLQASSRPSKISNIAIAGILGLFVGFSRRSSNTIWKG